MGALTRLAKPFLVGAQCVQQELDLSELTWMDTTPHQDAKLRLRQDSSIAVRTYLGFSPQMELF
ncbi:MAG: hypothetical protein HOI94_06010 [Candidatus Thioglobus sp.]|jgi:hypothetical protein|nr:hypothetical protein [Candidatus Thioglobus sp.]